LSVLQASGAAFLRVELTAQANVDATCTNPAGQTQPPGQNPAPISVSCVDEIPETEIKNGNTPFDVTTTGPETPIPGAPDCPTPQWTEDINDLEFTSARIQVFQAGVLVLTVDCTFFPRPKTATFSAGT
jgi:hypothetical protein